MCVCEIIFHSSGGYPFIRTTNPVHEGKGPHGLSPLKDLTQTLLLFCLTVSMPKFWKRHI
jgi:hypothetical protein